MLTSAMRYDNNRDNLTLDLTKCSGMEMLFFWQMSPNNYFPLILLSIGDPLSPPKGHLVFLQRTLNEIKLKQVLKGLLSRTFGSKHSPASAESLGQPVVPLTYLLPTWWKYGAFRTQMLIVPFFLFSSFFNISWWCDCRAIQQWPSCTQLADGWLENNKLLDETRRATQWRWRLEGWQFWAGLVTPRSRNVAGVTAREGVISVRMTPGHGSLTIQPENRLSYV